MIGQSQSGTGKTAAFVLTMLSRIDYDLNKPQAIRRPASARPLSELQSALGTLLGTGQSAAAQDYSTCVGQAGADVRKLQACADLLTK